MWIRWKKNVNIWLKSRTVRWNYLFQRFLIHCKIPKINSIFPAALLCYMICHNSMYDREEEEVEKSAQKYIYYFVEKMKNAWNISNWMGNFLFQSLMKIQSVLVWKTILTFERWVWHFYGIGFGKKNLSRLVLFLKLYNRIWISLLLLLLLRLLSFFRQLNIDLESQSKY